eukprot:TCONS_00053396-protein
MAARNGRNHTCKLCYDSYSKKILERIPRKLECLHTFCTGCIQKLTNLQGHTIECPLCFMMTITPFKGVDHLPLNNDIIRELSTRKPFQKCNFCIKTTYPPRSATLHCINCEKLYCGSCSDQIHVKEENLDHIIRLSNSMDDVQLSRQSSAKSGVVRSPQLEEKPANKVSSLVCSEHHQVLSLYCQKDKVRCCIQCRLSPQHQAHDCDFLKKSDEQDKNTLVDWHVQLEDLIDKQSKLRLCVQKTMEEVKKNTKTTQENIRKTFWSLKTLLDDVERDVNKEVENISQNKINQLQNQCSSMIEITSNAKTVSRLCEQSLDLDYFEMLVEKKKLEGDVTKAFEYLSRYSTPCEASDLFVQFPSHESILSDIKSLPYIVKVPPPPEKFVCELQADSSEVTLCWSSPSRMTFVYPINLFAVYASTGKDDSLELVKKINKKTMKLPLSWNKFHGKYLMQFHVTAINIIGESAPSLPSSIRLIKNRPSILNGL